MVVNTAWDERRGAEGLAGAFGSYPRSFLHAGRTITVFQDADAMVDPAYRGQGIFGRLTDGLNAEIARRGCLFHFGYPNSQSAPLLGKRPEAKMLRLSRAYAFPIGFANAASAHLGLKGAPKKIAAVVGGLAVRVWNGLHRYGRRTGLSLEPVTRFDERTLAWSLENAQHYRFCPVRDHDFLNWRAIDVPPTVKPGMLCFWFTEAGRKVGYCVLYNDAPRRVLKLLDVLCERPAEWLGRCVAAIRAFAIAQRFDVITTNVAGALHQKALEENGFWPAGDVAAYLLVTAPKAMERQTYDESFWLQLPIDRDNYDY